MLPGRTVFAELIAHVSPRKFRTCVDRYHGDYKASRFSCWDQFLCMAFAQLTYRESLRDIEASLRAVQPKLYHVGIRARVARSTLAEANETRDWRIYADFAQDLITTVRALYLDEPLGVDLANTVYALDATIIELCLSVFPWVRYRRHDAAVKMHTQLDLRGMIPTIVHITEGNCETRSPKPGRAPSQYSARWEPERRESTFRAVKAASDMAFSSVSYKLGLPVPLAAAMTWSSLSSMAFRRWSIRACSSSLC
jgi:hypothetical protein